MAFADWREFLPLKRGPGRAGYAAYPDRLVHGNSLRLLQDGRQAYPEMLAAIAAARESVNLETYILRDDKTGRRFAEALSERASAGVAARLIFDSVGSRELSPSFVQYLRNKGVQVLEYHPIAPWRPRWSWTRRDHRKILVVDGRVAFTGGMNISDDHAPGEAGGADWRDMDIRIEGPGAYDLDRIFRTTWFRETGRWFPSHGDPERRMGTSLVDVAANREFLERFRIRRSIIRAIERARRRITMSIAYFIPSRSIRRALYGAARRDVKVSILVPETSDVPAVSHASRFLFERHLKKGLRLFSWPGPVLHAKALAVDRVWATIGSYNFTHRSLMHNLEVNVHVLDRAFAAGLDDSIRLDMAASREITLDEWLKRPARDRLLEKFFYPLRYWF